MPKMYWIRVVMMIVTLVVVVLLMRNLNRGSGGADTGAEAELTLCPTRVTLLEIAADGSRVQQIDGKWMRTSANTKQELDPIAVEKWFSGLCSIAHQVVANGVVGFQPVLRLAYVSGQTQIVLRAPTGEFQLQGRAFSSPDLTESLRTLPTLPEAKLPGGG